MKNNRWRIVILLCALLGLVSAVAAGVYRKRLTRPVAAQETQKKQAAATYKPEQVTVPPIVHSGIKGLEIAGVRLQWQGRPDAYVEIDVLNNSDQAVTFIHLGAGPETETPSIGIDAQLDSDHPGVAIKPHSVNTFTWFLNGIAEGYPIVLDAAAYADGTEVGSERALKSAHYTREKFKRDRVAEKAKKDGQP